MNTKKISEISLIFLGLCLIVFLMMQFQAVLRPLAIAVLLAFLFTPYFRASKKERHKVIWKILIYSIFLIGILVVLASIFISTMSQPTKVSQPLQIKNNTTNFVETFSINIGGDDIYPLQRIDVNELLKNLNSLIGTAIGSLASFFSEVFTIIIFLIFMIPAINGGLKHISKNMQKKEAGAFLKALYEMENGIRQYLKVKTLVSMIVGGLSLAIMLIFGVKYAIIFALIVFLFNYVPSIGSIVAVALILIVELFTSGFNIMFVILAVLLIAIQVTIGNFVEPKLTGKRVEMSSLLVLLSLFFWGALWGVGGMLFSVPLTLAVRIIYKHLKENDHI